jgi:hypothetical protein
VEGVEKQTNKGVNKLPVFDGKLPSIEHSQSTQEESNGPNTPVSQRVRLLRRGGTLGQFSLVMTALLASRLSTAQQSRPHRRLQDAEASCVREVSNA